MKPCKFCKQPKKPYPKKSYVSKTVYDADPYCSAVCCRADHGIVHLKGQCNRDHERAA